MTGAGARRVTVLAGKEGTRTSPRWSGMRECGLSGHPPQSQVVTGACAFQDGGAPKGPHCTWDCLSAGLVPPELFAAWVVGILNLFQHTC